MKSVTDVRMMKKADAYACTHQSSASELIFKVGKAIADHQEYEDPVLVICGSGNNGSDGFVIASELKKKHKDVTLLLLNEKISEDGRQYYNECLARGIPCHKYEENFDFDEYKTIFDCIFGIGFHGEINGRVKKLFMDINASGSYIVSADINSGLNGDNGLCDACIDSDLTLAVNNYKCGHFLNMAKDHIKKLDCIDAGIVLQDEPYCLIEKEDIRDIFAYRQNYSHKGTYGYTALIGGCLFYSGAIRLANMANAALRSGTGVVKLAVPEELAPLIVPQILEATLFPLSSKNYQIVFDKDETDRLMSGTKAISIGMGIGNTKETAKLITYLLNNYKNTLIIDADGLNALAAMDKETIRKHKQPLILTPHLKECSRLLNTGMDDISKDPVAAAKKLAKEMKAIVLLKGTATVITDGEKVFLTNTGCPGMATAGSGDVLSGIITALCGYNEDDLLTAVSAAAYLNGLAGELAQKKNNAVSMTASDTVNAIIPAVSYIIEDK